MILIRQDNGEVTKEFETYDEFCNWVNNYGIEEGCYTEEVEHL